MVFSPLCSGKQIMQITPALEILSSYSHSELITECQFCPKDAWSAFILKSLVQCVTIPILREVNNKPGNEVPGKVKLQLGPVGVI